jgi:alkaline phosphatase
MKSLITLIICALLAQSLAAADKTNVIFFHPDGTGMAGWVANRMLVYGPDSESNWDKMDAYALYRGHQRDSLNTSSHAGATAHAFGKRVPTDSFGMFGKEPLKALSGFDGSILKEAQSKGLFVAIVNTGHIAEPGTAVYAASSPSRSNTDLIAKQVIESEFDVIMSGGETMLLPEGVEGHFGKPGIRKDGLNLIKIAEDNGYKVIYTQKELFELDPEKDQKVLGVFAAKHTFNDDTEEHLKEHGLPLYEKGAPTIGEMIKVTLEIAKASGKQFCIVAEEEATDNFANDNNATGWLEAYHRSDLAIGEIQKFIDQNPNTFLITAADSEAGGPEVISPSRDHQYYFKPNVPLMPRVLNGGALDGVWGTGGVPFESQPDQFGETHTFGIAWSTFGDISGGVIAGAHGKHADKLGTHIENTGVYRVMYEVLFGEKLAVESGE